MGAIKSIYLMVVTTGRFINCRLRATRMAKLDVRLEEIATREHFLATYKDTPKAEKCAQILDNAQVFPLTASSPAMVYLNILGTYVYLSGNLSINTKRDTRDTFQYSAGIARNGLNVPIEEIEEGL